MVQKTNAACLEFHTYISHRNSQNFVSNDLDDCCHTLLPQEATNFEKDYSTTKKEFVCSVVGGQKLS